MQQESLQQLQTRFAITQDAMQKFEASLLLLYEQMPSSRDDIDPMLYQAMIDAQESMLHNLSLEAEELREATSIGHGTHYGGNL